MTLAPDLLLADRYRLVERIAIGGMGEVWRARDELLDRDVAVKLLKQEYADDEAFLARFRAEARHTAGLSHPGIAAVYDYGELGDTSYLVMELVAGETLSVRLKREGRLTPDETLSITGQAALALDAAHQAGVIHRDVKPGNIIVRPDGMVKVTDFGIARAADAVPLTQTGTVLGTAYYLSPEQGSGKVVTPASDVYSLGVVAFECLSGHRPFDAETPVGVAMAHLNDAPPALPSDVPEPVRELVLKAMEKDPAARFATAGAFAQQASTLRSRLYGEDVGPGATSVMPVPETPASAETVLMPSADTGPQPPGRERPRRLALWLVAGLALVVVVALLLRVIGTLNELRVPTVKGKPIGEATSALSRSGFKADVTGSQCSVEPEGNVISQSPVNKAAPRGSKVKLVLSNGTGCPITNFPEVDGESVDAARAALVKLGLKVVVNLDGSNEPVGTVLSVDRAEVVRQGDTVVLHVARAFTAVGGNGGGGKGEKKKGKG
ncbi:MAG: protein kinase [Frankia sp.]|nr:protein kinase [Frankia sp.]